MPISGEIGQSFNASVNGVYAVVVTQNGCIDTSFCYNVISVGMTEITFLNGLSIYPNPSSDLITVKASNEILGLTFIIADQTGRQIMTGKLNNETTSVDISQLATGVYLFQVGQQRRQTFKMIKK